MDPVNFIYAVFMALTVMALSRHEFNQKFKVGKYPELVFSKVDMLTDPVLFITNIDSVAFVH